MDSKTNGLLYIYWERPELDTEFYTTFFADGDSLRLDSDLYLEITFENSPQPLIPGHE